MEALEKHLLQTYKFRYNTIENSIERDKKGKWDQVHEPNVFVEVNKNHAPTSKDYLATTVLSHYVSPPHNPIKAYFESLKLDNYKDKLPHKVKDLDPIVQLIRFILLEDESEEEALRFYKALRNWLVASIRCALEPKYVNKHVLTLQGVSGIGKSPFCEFITPPALDKYFKDLKSIAVTNKDNVITLTTNFLIVFEELDKFFKNPQNRDPFKAFVSTSRIKERLPWGRTEVYRQRCCSFLATCNETTFLNDPTGTQRFVVFSIKNFINKKYFDFKPPKGQFTIEDFPVDSLWAFAYQLYKSGKNYEYTASELELNEEKNEKYKYNTPEFETIGNYLAVPKPGDEVEWLTTTEICKYINDNEGVNGVKFKNVTLGKALRRLEFKNSAKRVNGIVKWGYLIKKV